uniref:YCII-related domain-containing protein n=1 Tax=Streptomyces phage Geonosis TaxID=3158856 RepID=A0AAU7GYH8_9CAUD
MGFSHSTYLAFGVHVPQDQFQTDEFAQETAWLDTVINQTEGLDSSRLGYLSAGDYDRDELFLTASEPGERLEVELGSFMVLAEVDTEGRAEAIKALAEAAGYTGLSEPGWLVVPDCS